MVDVCWAICEDGPMQGMVFELGVGDKLVNIPCDGVHQYRRRGFGAGERNSRIALFQYVKTLVI